MIINEFNQFVRSVFLKRREQTNKLSRALKNQHGLRSTFLRTFSQATDFCEREIVVEITL